MTSEVCIMNRHAAVLAADSATTVTRWTGEERETRYFKGANKIFQLSNHHPVGLMIYDSADILRVPWELVIKDFRRELGDKSFNELEGYANEFFQFLEGNQRMFPEDIRRSAFIEAARIAALTVIAVAEPSEGASGAQRAQAFAEAIASRLAELNDSDVAQCINDDLIADVRAAWMDGLTQEIRDWLPRIGVAEELDVGQLAELGFQEVIKAPTQHLSTTGLVFAGFGDHDVFPSSLAYTSCGLLKNRHLASDVVREAVDHETPASLQPFAQTSMANTFTIGISQDVYSSLADALKRHLATFANDVCAAGGGNVDSVADLPGMVSAASLAITKDWLDRAREDHAYPLRRVLGALPIDEMADLAETLINLQSLKEKVTKPSSTVGGPIDVAVITKNEGLVWIKRKHYFDAALNPRFMKRVGQ